MTVWPLLVTIFTLKNYELYGFVDGAWVSFALYQIYFAKFFWWESGYMRTIDIMLDRAGFYICWGCLAYIPGLYASVSMYLATHAVHLGTGLSLTILTLGVASCVVNYLADEQKLEVWFVLNLYTLSSLRLLCLFPSISIFCTTISPFTLFISFYFYIMYYHLFYPSLHSVYINMFA